MGSAISGSVLITGGTGSLGRAIVERAQSENWNAQFTILSRDEVKQSEMKREFPGLRYVLGNVSDLDWMRTMMRGHRTVIHAAAYKQVPSAEFNAREAVHANVMGSMAVAEAAIWADVERVVGVSTDKACAPVNAYGATKMLMEKVFQEASTWGDTFFTLCRYGNVLGSRGSVVPLFQKQHRETHLWPGNPAEQPGCMTVTDTRMTRFWLTLNQAVELVVQAYDLRVDGGIVVPKAPASTVMDVARAVCETCLIKDIGIRPGEKLHESLIHKGEAQHTEDWQHYFVVYPATQHVAKPLEDQFEYRSDAANRTLSVDDLRPLVGSERGF